MAKLKIREGSLSVDAAGTHGHRPGQVITIQFFNPSGGVTGTHHFRNGQLTAQASEEHLAEEAASEQS